MSVIYPRTYCLACSPFVLLSSFSLGPVDSNLGSLSSGLGSGNSSGKTLILTLSASAGKYTSRPQRFVTPRDAPYAAHVAPPSHSFIPAGGGRRLSTARDNAYLT